MNMARNAVGALFLATLAGTASAAINFTFDPTGTTGATGDIANRVTVDQAPGNALGVGAITAIQNFLGGAGPTTFTLYYQANLARITGSPPAYNQGDGGDYFTFTAAFGERVTSVAINADGSVTANFALDLTNPTNFFRMYRTGADGDDLNGTGFTSADLILQGTFNQLVTSNFTRNLNLPNTELDNYLGDDWNGQLTVQGGGASNIRMIVNSVDSDYFPDLLVNDFATLGFFNTSQVVPFDQVNPSRSVVGISTLAGAGAIGGVNGISGPSFLFQADANLSFERQAVPEPGMLLLISAGLIAGFVGRRRVVAR